MTKAVDLGALQTIFEQARKNATAARKALGKAEADDRRAREAFAAAGHALEAGLKAVRGE